MTDQELLDWIQALISNVENARAVGEHDMDEDKQKLEILRARLAQPLPVKSTVKCNACGSTEPEKYDSRFVKHKDWCPCRAGNQ